MEIKLIDNYFC